MQCGSAVPCGILGPRHGSNQSLTLVSWAQRSKKAIPDVRVRVEQETAEIVQVLQADEDVANCVQAGLSSPDHHASPCSPPEVSRTSRVPLLQQSSFSVSTAASWH